jgi:hypothetical protein
MVLVKETTVKETTILKMQFTRVLCRRILCEWNRRCIGTTCSGGMELHRVVLYFECLLEIMGACVGIDEVILQLTIHDWNKVEDSHALFELWEALLEKRG